MLGHPEVQYLDLAGGGKHDVLGLDVTVNDAMPVRRHQGFGTLKSNGEELIQRQWLPQSLAQVLAFHIFQNQEYLAVLLQHIINSGYVGIAEAGGALRLFEEAVAVNESGRKEGARRLRATVRLSLVSSAL